MKRINITSETNLWSRCFTVHSLVIIGSKELNGAYNMAAKHMAMPMGTGPYFGFMGAPHKTTYQNVKREGVFTVSYPRPKQLVISTLTASRREKDDSKPIIRFLPTVDARQIDGKFLKDSYLQLECKLHKILGKFSEWELVTGEIVAAYVHEEALRIGGEDNDDTELIHSAPLLAYLHPDRFGEIKKSHALPLPKNFKR